MFVCKECAEKNDLVKSWYVSYGRCEICGENRKCSDAKFNRKNAYKGITEGK